MANGKKKTALDEIGDKFTNILCDMNIVEGILRLFADSFEASGTNEDSNKMIVACHTADLTREITDTIDNIATELSHYERDHAE